MLTLATLVQLAKSIAGEALAPEADIVRVPRPCSEAVKGEVVEDPTCTSPLIACHDCKGALQVGALVALRKTGPTMQENCNWRRIR